MPTPAPVCACLRRVTCLTLSRAEFERLMGPVEQVLAEHIAQYAQANAAQQAAGQSADAPPPELGEAAAAAGPAKPPSLAGSTAGSPGPMGSAAALLPGSPRPSMLSDSPSASSFSPRRSGGRSGGMRCTPRTTSQSDLGDSCSHAEPSFAVVLVPGGGGLEPPAAALGAGAAAPEPRTTLPPIAEDPSEAGGGGTPRSSAGKGSGVHGGGNGKPTGAAIKGSSIGKPGSRKPGARKPGSKQIAGKPARTGADRRKK